jgi:hypothetical protein
MMPAPLHPTPARHVPFPPNWRSDEPLEYTPEGSVLPARGSLLERVYMWICKRLGVSTGGNPRRLCR